MTGTTIHAIHVLFCLWVFLGWPFFLRRRLSFRDIRSRGNWVVGILCNYATGGVARSRCDSRHLFRNETTNAVQSTGRRCVTCH